MAFKKTYRKNKKTLVKRVAKIEKEFKPEMKQVYFSQAITVMASGAWQTHHLTSIAEGTNFQQRIGNLIKVQRIRMRFYLTYNASAVLRNQAVRIMILKTNQQISSVAPTSTTVVPTAVAPFMDFTSNQWIQTNGEYVKTLYDKHYIVGNDLGGSPGNKFVDIDLKHLNIPVRYNAGTNSAIQKNGIYLFLVSDDGSINGPAYEAVMLVDYSDV